jgi:gluconolactonase
LVKLFVLILVTAAASLGQNFTDVAIEKMATGFSYADGPVWSRDGYLVFSDVPKSMLLQLVPLHPPPHLLRENANGASGNAYDLQGRLYTCESHLRRIVRTDKKGKVETLVDTYQGKKLNAPNDIVVRKDFHAYFTDPAFGNQQDSRELDFYGVYHITPKGEVELTAKPKGRPNGIALSPNGRILYVTNSDERNIRAYDLDQKGAATNERVIVANIEGVPNGIRVDENGNLYVVAAKVNVYSPAGKSLGVVALNEPPSNCAFGDPDFGSLYVTARTSVYRLHLGAKGSVQY